MARIRSIAPEACESRTLAQLTDFEERAWWRLLTHMDDQGRGKDDALLLCSKAFAVMRNVDEDMVEDALKTYARLRLIVRYEVDGQRYIQVRSWPKHQHPKEPGKVRIPPPPGWHIVDREWVECDPSEPTNNPDPAQSCPNPGPDPTQGEADPGSLELGVGSWELGDGNLSTSRPHGSSPALSTGPPTTTTTEDRHPEALAACQLLAVRALELRRAERPDDAPPPGVRTERWLRAATTDQLTTIGDQAQALAAAGLDAPAIAAQLARPPNGHAPPHLAIVPKPVYCDSCGTLGHPTAACPTFPDLEAHP